MRSLAAIAVALVALFVSGLALAQEARVEAGAICKDGKLVAVQVIAPFAGIITIPMPEDPCKPQKNAPKPEPEKRPARST